MPRISVSRPLARVAPAHLLALAGLIVSTGCGADLGTGDSPDGGGVGADLPMRLPDLAGADLAVRDQAVVLPDGPTDGPVGVNCLPGLESISLAPDTLGITLDGKPAFPVTFTPYGTFQGGGAPMPLDPTKLAWKATRACSASAFASQSMLASQPPRRCTIVSHSCVSRTSSRVLSRSLPRPNACITSFFQSFGYLETTRG